MTLACPDRLALSFEEHMDPIKLSKPIKVGEKEISEITLREPTLGDLIAGEAVGGASQTAKVAATLASMADIPFPAFKTITARDFMRINEAAEPLMGNGEAAGTN